MVEAMNELISEQDVNYRIRVFRVIRETNKCKSYCIIYSGIWILSVGLSFLVLKFRPDFYYYWAFPIVYGIMTMIKWWRYKAV